MYSVNNTGPRTDLLGTPYFRSRGRGPKCSMGYTLMISIRQTGGKRLRACPVILNVMYRPLRRIRISWFIVSKAADKSNTKRTRTSLL